MNEKLNRADIRFLIICGVVFAVCLAIGLKYFGVAFPEASIEFEHDRDSSRAIAEKFLGERGYDFKDYKHAVEFTHDDNAKVFLERKLGLEKANAIFGRDVKIWYWRHRWFKPLQKEELRVNIAPTGEIVAFEHIIPEESESAPNNPQQSLSSAEELLRRIGVDPRGLNLVSRSEKKLPKRTEETLTWESRTIRHAGAPYRYNVTVAGQEARAIGQMLRVPEQWEREYQELRSRNQAAGAVDSVLLILTIVASLVVFIARLRRGDVQVRFTVITGLIGGLLVAGVALNQFPSALAHYETTQSYTAFLTRYFILQSLLPGVAVGLFLMVIVGAGEALYRERLPKQLAMSRVFRADGLRSKSMFKSFILGYTLFAAFLAYQVVFYIVASRLGAWSPADIPYNEILNTWFPWIAVLFMGFFPAVSEEFMSRAFSIPFLERFVKSPFLAIVIAGFIWGFGHAAYPNQPFYIRGIEVGVAGVVIGLLMYRFGILPLLIWHYTVDALYTSVLLFRSNNLYYILSAGAASLVFALPMVISIVLYFRNGGFRSEEPLLNEAVGTVPPGEVVKREVGPLPAAKPVTARYAIGVAVLVGITIGLLAVDQSTLNDVVDYKIDKRQSIEIARRHLAAIGEQDVPSRVIATPRAGFREWDEESKREDGGGPGDYNSAAAEYLVKRLPKPIEQLVEIEKTNVEAATWGIRFFEPLEKVEIYVEVDPRTSRVVGYHKYVEEEMPGAALDRARAEGIARAEFARYGLDASQFELKEALSFQQPKRLDWLFHYDDRMRLAGEANRRASVRVVAGKVTQFAKTVRIPERDRREAEKETVINTLIVVGKVVGNLGLVALALAGMVLAVRQHGFAWRESARWTARLAILPIVASLLQLDAILAHYQTEIQWNTFIVTIVASIVMMMAFQIAGVFVALMIIETIYPSAFRVLTRDGSRMLGRGAVIATIALLALDTIESFINASLPLWFPQAALIAPPNIPDAITSAFPMLGALWEAVFRALVLSAAVAGLVALLELGRAPRWALIATAIVLLILAGADADATGSEIAVTFASATLSALVFYVIIRFILRDNLFAYPLAFFTGGILQEAARMLQNDRGDLKAQGFILIAIAVAVMIALAMRTPRGATGDSIAHGH